MDTGVGLGLELVGQEPAVRLGQFHRLAVHAQALLSAGCEHDLGAHHPHQLAALDRKAVGHRHHQRIALRRADHGQPDAGVARRRLDHRLTRAKASVLLGLLDDAQRQPVLYRPGRIEGLDLHVEIHALRRESVDPDRRGVPDGVQNAVEQPPASLSRVHRDRIHCFSLWLIRVFALSYADATVTVLGTRISED